MHWQEELKEKIRDGALLLGVGNELKSDDGIGPLAVKRVRYENKLNCETVPENFVFKIKKMEPACIVIVDAVKFGGEPGEIGWFEAGDSIGPKISTHNLPLSVFRSFFEGTEVFLLGVQPESIEFGEPSEKAREAIEEIVNAVDAAAGF